MALAKGITNVMGYFLSIPLDLLLVLGHFLAHFPVEKVRTPIRRVLAKIKAFIAPSWWLIANPLVAAPFYTLQITGMGIFGYSSAWLGMLMALSLLTGHGWMIILLALFGLTIGLFT